MVFARLALESEDRLYGRYYAQQQATDRAMAEYANAEPLVRRLVELNERYPGMRASLILAAARAGLDDDQVGMLWERQQRAEASEAADSRWSGGPISDLFSGVIPAVSETVGGRLFKGTTRVGTAALASLWEVPYGMLRNTQPIVRNIAGDNTLLAGALGGAVAPGQEYESDGVRNPLAQSRFFQLLSDPSDQGSGFFMGGDVERRTVEAQREALRVRGADNKWHAYTVGRGAFGAVPGTPGKLMSGLADAAIMLRLDPATPVSRAASGAARATQAFRAADEVEEVGVLASAWRTVLHGDTARHWFDSEKGQRVVQSFADTSDAATIMRATNMKMPREVAHEISQTANPAEVRKILEGHLGIDIMQKPAEIIDGARLTKFRPTTRRFAAKMPGVKFNPNDLDEGIVTLDRSMMQAGVKLADRDKVINKLAAARGQQDVLEALVAYRSTVKSAIMEDRTINVFGSGEITKAQERLLDDALNMWSGNIDSTRVYATDLAGNSRNDLPVVLGDGTVLPTGPGPISVSELLSRDVILPDVRELKRLASNGRRLFALGVLDDSGKAVNLWDATVINLGDKWMSFWRASVLWRVGAMIRNVGEAHAASAVNGYATPWTHPLQYIAYTIAMGNKQRANVMRRTFTDDEWFPELAKNTSKIVGMTVDPVRFRANYGKEMVAGFRFYERGDKFFPTAYAEEIVRMANDPIEREIARVLYAGGGPEGLDALRRRLWDGDMRSWREALHDPRDVVDGAEQAARTARQAIDTEDGWKAYFEQQLVQRVSEHVDKDGRLLEAIAKQRFGKTRLSNTSKGSPPEELIAAIREDADLGIGVPKVRGREVIGGSSKQSAVFNWVVDGMWNLLYGVPSNRLANHPGFKQMYGEELARLHAYADDAAQDAIVKYVPKELWRKASPKGTKTPDGVARLTMDEADKIAQRRALDRAKQVFYDLSSDDKVSAWDTLRYVTPFGAAWQDSLKRWGSYIADNPNIVRRLHQGLEGAQDIGVIKEDPTTGELILNLPVANPGAVLAGIGGNAMFGDMLPDPGMGIPLGLTGRVAGLNMIGQVYPGVGPLVQVPVTAFAPDDTPGWQKIREFVVPFTSGKTNAFSAAMDAMTPGWADRVLTAVGAGDAQERKLLEQQAARNYQYLASEADPDDLADPTYQKQMERKARTAAIYQFTVRGIYQVFSPTAPAFDPKVKLKDGRLGDVYALGEHFNKLVNKYSREPGIEDPTGAAMMDFLAEFGENLYVLFQPMSYTTNYGTLATNEFDEWATRNRDTMNKYRPIAGLFAPVVPEGEFDFDAYNRQFRTGDRQSYFDGSPLAMEEWIQLGQHKMGQIVYRNLMRKVVEMGLDDSPEAVRLVHKYVYEQFPGWRSGAEAIRRKTTELPDAILMLEEMANDPATRNMPGVESVRTYLEARQQAVDAIGAMGLSNSRYGRALVSDAQAALPIRLWLAQVGNRLMLADPYFARVWDELLAREANIGDAYDEAAGVDADRAATNRTEGVLG